MFWSHFKIQSECPTHVPGQAHGSQLTLLSEETKSINLITRYLIGIDLKLGCNPPELILHQHCL